MCKNLFFADLSAAAGKAFGLPNALQPKWRAVCLGDTLHESADFSSLEVEQADTATLLFSMSKQKRIEPNQHFWMNEFLLTFGFEEEKLDLI